jgi:hypothetical protein
MPGFSKHVYFDDNLSNAQLIDASGDGRLDIFGSDFINGSMRRLSLFLNRGDTPPTFGRKDIAAELPWDFEIGRGADVDGDGDIDFYAQRHEENCGLDCAPRQLVWLENTGTFPYVRHLIDEGGGLTIEAIDADQDGDVDVVVGSTSPFVWWENENATFTEEHLVPSSEVITSLVSADLDGDGDTDLIGRSSGSDHRVFWFENDGSGSFDEHLLHIFPGQPFTSAKVVADFSGDGLLDVLLASQFDPVWLENLGGSPLAFREHSLIDVVNEGAGDGIGSIAGDIDLDGRADFVADAATLDWYRNQIGRRLVVGGMGVRGFLCRNRTTGQTVRVPTTDTAIDCENEGLAVDPGDEVEVFARGQAE